MNLLRELVETARETIQSGYYRHGTDLKPAPSLLKAVRARHRPGAPALIAEIKPATPLRGKIVSEGHEALMARFLAEGAAALSVLTEPRHFHGNLALLRKAVATKAPVLMKDIILAEEQIDCAASFGASAVLLIASALPRSRVPALIEYAHLAEREVLLEVASPEEYRMAQETEADLVGTNNRDLRTFAVDIGRTLAIAQACPKEKPLVSLSGFETRADVLRVSPMADAVLVGTSLLEGRTTVRELVGE